jgi:aspartyl aminopeptidase
MNKNYINQLIDFINDSPTAFQVTKNIVSELEQSGFVKLNEKEKWNLEKNKSYFVVRNQSSVIAFKTGNGEIAQTGFKLIGAHSDSPALKIKSESESVIKNNIKIGVEIYGGPIKASWTDRELSIAGRVIVKDGEKYESKLIDFKNPVAIIPNLPIHLNNKINEGFNYNAQEHLQAIIGLTDNKGEKNFLKNKIADNLGIEQETIFDFDLFLYDCAKSKLCGFNNEFLVSGRLDNLAMTHAILKAILETENNKSVDVAVFFDNEEIGSRTLQGADSSFLNDTLQRISFVESNFFEDYKRAIANSFLISSDMAHAFHPDYPSKHDPFYTPEINKGPVIKYNANYRYSTTAESAAYFANICEKAGVPYQKMTNRSDMKSGSTIGPMTSAALGIKSVDIGNPMWAMHSTRETAGTLDHNYVIKAFKEFYK